jgi:hypothetical protein
MFREDMRETELANVCVCGGGIGLVAGGGWKELEGWPRPGGGNWENNWRYKFDSRKSECLYAQSHNNLEFVTLWWEGDKAQFNLIFQEYRLTKQTQ